MVDAMLEVLKSSALQQAKHYVHRVNCNSLTHRGLGDVFPSLHRFSLMSHTGVVDNYLTLRRIGSIINYCNQTIDSDLCDGDGTLTTRSYAPARRRGLFLHQC